jgi:hypothetical protein
MMAIHIITPLKCEMLLDIRGTHLLRSSWISLVWVTHLSITVCNLKLIFCQYFLKAGIFPSNVKFIWHKIYCDQSIWRKMWAENINFHYLAVYPQKNYIFLFNFAYIELSSYLGSKNLTSKMCVCAIEENLLHFYVWTQMKIYLCCFYNSASIQIFFKKDEKLTIIIRKNCWDGSKKSHFYSVLNCVYCRRVVIFILH